VFLHKNDSCAWTPNSGFFLILIVIVIGTVMVIVIVIVLAIVIVIIIKLWTILTLMMAELITSTVTMLHTRNQCLDSKAWKPNWARHRALHMRMLFNWV